MLSTFGFTGVAGWCFEFGIAVRWWVIRLELACFVFLFGFVPVGFVYGVVGVRYGY